MLKDDFLLEVGNGHPKKARCFQPRGFRGKPLNAISTGHNDDDTLLFHSY